MDLSERITLLDTVLERHLQWIRAADSKIPPVIALDLAMLGVIAALSPDHDGWTLTSEILATLCTLALLVSLVCAALASFPRTTGPERSLIYFRGIKDRKVKEYRDEILRIEPDGHFDDLVKQCHRNAEIADRKYKFLQWSMVSLFVGTVPWLVAVYYLYRTGADVHG